LLGGKTIMKRFRALKRWQKILVVVATIVVGLPVLLVVVLGLLPAPTEPILAADAVVVGAQSKAGSLTGVQTEFPAMPVRADNPTTREKQDLGRLLFFDPILSAKNDMSCATCHHPDLGLSNGEPKGKGADGKLLDRSVPSLYEVGYSASLFWDGRAPDLEAQARTPLTAPNEMAATPEQLVSDLKAIDEYKALFAKAFPGQTEPITLDNVTFALAAFERSLLAHDSPFDRYAKGDLSALSPSQRRGFALFRSGATGCYKCHAAPTFSDGKFEVTGVPDADGKLSDQGRAAVSGKAAEANAFKVPSLRNVALTAPYMHNGRFATIEEAVAFYARGGGAGMGLSVPNQTRFVNPFDLSAQETSDLISFLYALTDESAKPAIPDKVPSGFRRWPMETRLGSRCGSQHRRHCGDKTPTDDSDRDARRDHSVRGR
jgi:cytochrome c peroxidase